MAAFDIAEPQVLLLDPSNPIGDWVHVVLLRRVDGAKWVCLNQDRAIDVKDLSDRQLHGLTRRGAFPETAIGCTVLFTAAPTEEELGLYHSRAEQLLRVFGSSTAAAVSPW